MRPAREVQQGMAAAEHQEPATNGRRHIRYPLRAQIAYRWSDSQGFKRRGHGWTLNVSEGGLLVRGEDCPKEGELVELTWRVPSPRVNGPDSSLRMQMTGKVVRLLRAGQEGKHAWFAVSQRTNPVVEESSQSSWQLWDVASLRTN